MQLPGPGRKRDTRWKILVVGAVLARATTDLDAARCLDRIMDEALTADRELLEEWRSFR